MQDFRELRVWEKAHEITLAVYKVTKTFPKDELYGLTSQIRRQRPRSARTLQKGAAEKRGRILLVSYRMRSGLPVNWSITYYWHGTSDTCQQSLVRDSRLRFAK